MGWIPDSFLDDLRSRIRLEELVAEYVPLKRNGSRYMGLCPFHNEKTPSFSVNAEEQFYYCFGCHASGTAIKFVEEMEHLDFTEAVHFLADRLHMQVPEGQAPRSRNSDYVSSEERDRICEANVAAARYYNAALYAPEGAEMLSYLYKRGLNDSDIRRFGLGAAPNGRTNLVKLLREKGFDDALLKKAGLAVEREGKLVDMFRNRAIFPIINPAGKVIGFGGRAMGDAQPKYLNTPDTPVFNKRKGLYALNFARKERGLDRLVLVEGYMDTVSLRKYGVRGVVATLGTALTEEQALLIRRHVSQVWVSYDGDPPGQKAALRALDIFDKVDGITARVIDYPAGQDPDDFIRANGLEGFEKLPRYDAAEYRMLRARDGLDLSTQEGMTQYAMRCCDILRGVKNPILLENYLRSLVAQTGYEREILLRQIGTVAAEPERRRELRRRPVRPSTAEEASPEERAVLTLLAQDLIPREMVAPEDFSREICRRAAKWLLDGKGAAALLERTQDDGERAALAAMMNFTPLPDSREDCLRLAETSLSALRKARLRSRMSAIAEEIKAADPARKAELYRQMQRITEEIEED